MAATMDLSDVGPLSDVLTADYLEYYGVLPVEAKETRLRVATWRESVDPQAVDDLSTHFAAEVELVTMPEQAVRTAIQRAYGEDAVTAQDVIAFPGFITHWVSPYFGSEDRITLAFNVGFGPSSNLPQRDIEKPVDLGRRRIQT